MEEEHKYLKALKYGYEHPDFTLEEITEATGVSISGLNLMLQQHPGKPIQHTDYKEGEAKQKIYQLTFEAVMSHLEYIELQEARQSAQDAKAQAHVALLQSKRAMYISALLAVGSIILGVYGQFSHGPTQVAITRSQMEGLMGLRPRPPYEVTLNQEQLRSYKTFSQRTSPCLKSPEQVLYDLRWRWAVNRRMVDFQKAHLSVVEDVLPHLI